MRDDPYSMDFGRQAQQRKDKFKPVADISEFQKHQRGAFRQSEDSPIFTMNPKSEEFKQELNRRQYEHSLPYFDQDTQKLQQKFDEPSDISTVEPAYVEPIAFIPQTHKKPDWQVVEPLHYVNEEQSPDDIQFVERVPLYHKSHKQHY